MPGEYKSVGGRRQEPAQGAGGGDRQPSADFSMGITSVISRDCSGRAAARGHSERTFTDVDVEQRPGHRAGAERVDTQPRGGAGKAISEPAGLETLDDPRSSTFVEPVSSATPMNSPVGPACRARVEPARDGNSSVDLRLSLEAMIGW